MDITKEANQGSPLSPQDTKREQGYLTLEGRLPDCPSECWTVTKDREIRGIWMQDRFHVASSIKLEVIAEQQKLHPAILNRIKNSQLCGNPEYGMFSQFPQDRRELCGHWKHLNRRRPL